MEIEEKPLEEGGKDLPLSGRFSLGRLLQRAHEGLGHPNNPNNDRFVRILRYANAKPNVIEEAKKLRCSVCQRHQQVRPARRAAPPKELDFNDCVGVDVVYLPLPNGKTRPSLNIIDWSSKFQLVIPTDTKRPGQLREAYRHWLRLFGPPKGLAIDMGKEFKGVFAQAAESDGTYVDPAAVEAPHQRGITERHGKTFKFMLMKAMDTYNCTNVHEWEELVGVTIMTKNRMLQHNGFSPSQRVFGFNLKIPEGLLSDDGGNRVHPDKVRQGDLTVERSMRMRKAAAEAFLEADADEALRRAVQDYDIGEMIYFYRMGADKAKKFAPGYWCGPARIMMIDQLSTIWASYQGTLVKAAPERVRRASLEENLSLSGWLTDLVKNKQDPCTDPKKGYIDLTDHPLPPEVERAEEADEEEYEPSVMDDDELTEALKNQPMKRRGPPLGPKPLRRYYGKQEQDKRIFFRHLTLANYVMDLKDHLNSLNQLNYLYLTKFLETKGERRWKRQGLNVNMEAKIQLEKEKNDPPKEAERSTWRCTT